MLCTQHVGGALQMTDETGHSRPRRGAAIALIVLWGLAFFGSFVVSAMTPARDFGLSQGWNKVGVFMGWQVAATALAFVSLVMARYLIPGSGLRRLAMVPAALTALLAVTVAALTLYSGMTRPPAGAGPDRPVTQTAPPPA
jgi:hypothetical protein